MKKFWLKFKKWILLILSIGTVTTAVLLGAPATDTISPDKVSTLYNQATDIKAKYQLNEVSLIKTDIKNAELDAYKGEPKDEVKVIIGDNEPKLAGIGAGEQEFKPNIELKRWNEVSFKLKTDNLLKDVATKDKKLSFEGDKIKFDTPRISFEMYDYTEGEGGYKFIWYLNSKPATNKVEFNIESSGLNFYRQPPLTEEYQNGYSEEFQKEIVVTETQVKDLDGNVLVERPENVVGSYAVFHSTKGGMNDTYGKDYKTGQAFFIYPSHITDAEGKISKAILKIENGIFSEEIQQEFLDKAVYPLRGNTDFGYKTVGGSTYAGQNSVVSTIATPASAGTVDAVSIYFNYTSVSIKNRGAIYLGNNVISNGETNELIGTLSPVDWYLITYTNKPSITVQSYDIAIWINSTNSIYYNTGSGTNNHYYTRTYASPPTTFTDPATWTNSTAKRSIYATYTPSGGGAVEEVINQTLIITPDF